VNGPGQRRKWKENQVTIRLVDSAANCSLGRRLSLPLGFDSLQGLEGLGARPQFDHVLRRRADDVPQSCCP
jgi:hypothetical protein